MGAQKFSLDLMNEKIEKSIRGNINRRQNFDEANMKKSVDRAQAAIVAIRYLEEEGVLETLPETLQKAAKLRIAYPEVSLGELLDRSEEKLTKSGLYHRLQKLVALAEKRKEKETV
jgi:DNA-binding protein WhiA